MLCVLSGAPLAAAARTSVAKIGLRGMATAALDWQDPLLLTESALTDDERLMMVCACEGSRVCVCCAVLCCAVLCCAVLMMCCAVVT